MTTTLPGADQRIWTRDFGLLWISRLCQFSASHVMVPVFPLYLAHVGLGSAGIGLVSALFYLAATVIRPFLGYLVDLRGARATLVLFLIPFFIAPFGYLLSTSVVLIALFRVLQGAGFSATSAGSALASNILPAARRGAGLGTYHVASNVAGALSATFGVWLYYRSGAGALFVASGLVALAALVTAIPVREPAVAASRETAKGLGMYLRRYLTRDTLAITIPMSAVTFATGGVYAFLSLQAVSAGFSNPGVYFTLYAVAQVVVRPLSGGVSDRFERRLLVLPAFAPLVGALMLLAWQPGTWVFFVAPLLHALGHGTLEAVLVASLVDRVPPERRGAAMSQWSLFYDLGLGAGGTALGVVLSWTNQSYAWMYTITAGVALVGMVVYAVMNPPQRKAAPAHADIAARAGAK